MKYALCLAFVGLSFGCETVENPDGSTTTRFDGKSFASALDTSMNAYDRLQRQQQPVPTVVGYDIYGRPIYAN